MNKNSTYSLHTGNDIPVLGLGTWQLKENTAEAIEHALKLGYPMIDTSSDYKTQPGIGEGLKRSGIPREDIYIVTKVEEDDDAYERTTSNLAELQLEYVDLTLIHRPPPDGAGEELWQGLIQAQEEGLTRDIGVSNYPTELIDRLIGVSGEVPVVNQIEWSPFGHSQEMVEYCQEKNIIIMAYSPLTRNKRIDDPTIKQIADFYDKSPAQILIRWSLQKGFCPIPKANQKEHQAENLDVFDFEISDEDMATLDDLNDGYSTFGSPLPYI